MKNSKVLNLMYCATFTALIAVGAFIKIPIPMLPFTLQFLFVMLAGLLLGGKLGAISVLVYILMGLIGFPVFTGGGGFSYILKPSFGYILGFILAAFVIGTVSNKVPYPSYKRLLAANFSGMAIVYLIGVPYYYMISNFYLGSQIGVRNLFIYCFLLFLPSDATFCILSAIIAKRLIPFVNKHFKSIR